MSSLNRAMILGNLTKDVESRTLQSGSQFATFSVATNESWTDSNGQKHERTEFHSIEVYSKLAEICAKFLAKGRQVYVEGRIESREWDGKDGQKKYKTVIKAEKVIFVGGTGGGAKPIDEFDQSFGNW